MTANQELTYVVKEMLLKLRKGAAASLNAARLEEIFAYMPGWKIEKAKMMKPSNGGWIVGRELPGGSYHRSFMKNDDGRIHYVASILPPTVKGADHYENGGREEDSRKIEVLRTRIYPELVALSEKATKKWRVSDVRYEERPGYSNFIDHDVSYFFEALCNVNVITAPDGQTFEVFGDHKNGASAPKTFVDFYNWAVEETNFLDTVLDLLGMEAVEKKHDPRTPYVPGPADSRAIHYVFGVLKTLTESVRAEQKIRMIERMTKTAESFAKFAAENPEQAEKTFGGVLGGLVRVWNRKENKLTDDWKTVIENMAEREVEAMQNMFVYKNTRKLAPIIDGKGEEAEIEVIHINVRQGIIEAELSVKFSDGANFRVKQSTVYSNVSDRWGRVTYFYRFPSTFHDAYLANGERIKNVDEEQMNVIFAKDR